MDMLLDSVSTVSAPLTRILILSLIPLTDTKITPPKGWTTERRRIGFDNLWGRKTSEGQRMARDHGLKFPKPIMDTIWCGEMLYIFQSRNMFYLWSRLDGSLLEIVLPTGLEDIVTTIAVLGYSSLALKGVDPVPISE